MNTLSILRTRIARLVLPISGLLLAGALMFTYLRTQEYDTAGYFENVALLRQVKQLDARWELDAMKSHVGLNQSYDPLVDPLRDMSILPQHLSALTETPHAGDAVRLRAAVAAYEDALKNKSALVEAFKSHNAVLRNSLTFLPTAVDDIEFLAGPHESPVKTIANRVLLATLIYNQIPSDEEKLEAQEELDGLSTLAGQLEPQMRQRVDLLAMHAAIILNEHGMVSGLLNQIADVPTAARIDDISNLLSVEQQRAVQQLQTYRHFLSLLAAALIGLLLYAAARLIRSHATINRVNAELHNANEHLERRVRERTDELVQTNACLQTEMSERKQLESLLVQSEKLASIGQLAAGVAHEINNPIGYIFSNFGTLQTYLAQLFDMLDVYQQAEAHVADADMAARLRAMRADIDLNFLREDIPALMTESKEGIVRVRHIVQDLKDFSRVDANQEWVWANLHQGIDSTLNIVSNEVKYKADVVKEYGDIPDIECLPLQINQVVMNLVVNAAHAIGPERGRITVRTGRAGEQVWLEVEDNGSGIAPMALSRIFDPFFTTKAVGKGTGLGLSLAYGIVQKHQGRITVDTALGKGTTFRVFLPVQHADTADQETAP